MGKKMTKKYKAYLKRISIKKGLEKQVKKLKPLVESLRKQIWEMERDIYYLEESAYLEGLNSAKQKYKQQISRLEKELAEEREEYRTLHAIMMPQPSPIIITEFHMDPDSKYTATSGGSGGDGK